MGMVEFEEYLKRLPSGPIEDVSELVNHLEACWDLFSGSESEGMAAAKLDRMEQVHWKAPCLTFVIERHGGTVLGSTRGELHSWYVDVDRRTAECTSSGYRQLEERDKRFNAELPAAEIAELVLSGSNSPRLKWSSDRGSVTVLVGDFITGKYKQTTVGRRSRFREALAQRLQSMGWEPVSRNGNRYRRVQKQS
jgi:hypothetical protein